MYPLRSFLILLLLFFSLSFIGEYVVGPWMGDDIPLWKILAVSLITALSTIIPLQKRGLKPGDIFKYFRRRYFAPQLLLPQLIPHLRDQFPEGQFKLKHYPQKAKLSLSRKANWQTFGEHIQIRKDQSEIVLCIRPKFYLDVFDQGQAHESLLKIEQIIKTIQND